MKKWYAVPILAVLLTGCPGKAEPTPTSTPTSTPRPTVTQPTLSPTQTIAEESATEYGVTPGAYCGTRGSVGVGRKNNLIYTCKGPGDLRWRR